MKKRYTHEQIIKAFNNRSALSMKRLKAGEKHSLASSIAS